MTVEGSARRADRPHAVAAVCWLPMNCHRLLATGAFLFPLLASAQRPNPHTQLDALLKELVENNGWFYGRGVIDDKQGDAILIATLLRMKQDGFVPDRDLIVALTADEETDGTSITWLIEKN